MKARTLIACSLLAVFLLIEIPVSIGFSQFKKVAAANAASACTVSYQVNQWTGGFTAQVQVTNNGAALNGWTVTWTFAGNQQITSAWNTVVTQSGAAVTARDAGYNASVPAGGTLQFGFQGTFSGSNATPTNFALNGSTCGGSATPTPTVSTTPTLTPTPTATTVPTVTPTPTVAITPTPQPTSTPGTGCPAGAVFCDGFENQTGTTPGGVWQVSYANCQGTGTATVDRTVAHSGTTSIRINGFNGYCNHVFFGIQSSTFASAGSDFYVRFFVRHTTALPVTHVTFAAMRDANDGGNDLRMGGQNGALQWNRQSDDATLPEQSPAGVALSTPLPTNQWECVQFEVNQPQGNMRTWLNGSEVAGLHLDNVPTLNIDSQWLQNRPNWRPSITDLRFGWESYSGGDDTLWFDDIAVGSHLLSC